MRATTTHQQYRRYTIRCAIVRAIGWCILAGTVFIVSGLGATWFGRHPIDYTPSGTGYGYHRTATCPTEDSCRRVWTGDQYVWVPQVP